MRKIYLALLAAFMFSTTLVMAQVSGIKTIGVDYLTIAAAVSDLNTNGIGAGGVTINVPAGYTETLSGPIVLTATGTATNPIIIQKSGSGANPLLTAYSTGTATPSSISPDGFIVLAGSDYVTLDGINMIDPTSNNTVDLSMEFGVGLFKASDINGCQNNTIQNCTISLNTLNNTTWSVGHNGSIAIVVFNSIYGAATTAVTVTDALGSNSYNKFYSNTLQNCNAGIAFTAFAAPSPYTLGDTGNDVGGTSAATGNSILNFGGGAATNPATGIFSNNQWGLNISNNIINNNTGTNVNHATTLRGIFLNSSSAGASAIVNNNTISLKFGGTTTQVSCIENSAGNGGGGNTIAITNNTISNCTNDAATTSAWYGIYTTSTASNVNISGNTISNNTKNGTVLTSGLFYGIYNTAAAPSLTIQNNTISNLAYGLATTTATGAIYPIYNTASVPSLMIRDNLIRDIARLGSTGGTTIGIYCSTGSNVTSNHFIKNNQVRNLSINGTGSTSTMYGIQVSTGTVVVDSNTIDSLRCLKTTGTGLMYGIYNIGSPNNENYNYNEISNLIHSGTGTTYGLYSNSTAGTKNISFNSVHDVQTAGTTIAGIYSLASTPSIFNNKVYNIQSNSTASPTVSGILLGSVSSTGAAIYNNLVGDIKAPSASSATEPVRGISITSTSTGVVYVFHNTVYLNASSTGANFGSAAFFATSSATATASALTLGNNIFINNSVASGTGKVVAYRRSTTTSTNFAASNNNIFYAGTPSASNAIFYDGTNTDQLLGAYQSRFAPFDALSFTENTSFVSTTGSNPNFLKPVGGVQTFAESNGATSAVTSDFGSLTARATFPQSGQVNGGGTAPDMGAWEFDGIPYPTCTGVSPTVAITSSAAAVCLNTSATMSVSGVPANTLGYTYQWAASATQGGPYTNMNTSSTQATGNLANTMYYVVTVSCAYAGSPVTTPEATIGTIALPVVSTTSSGDTLCSPYTAGTTINANGALTYTWAPAATLNSSTGSTVIASPTALTTYTVTGTDGNGCVNTATRTVSVFNTPTVAPAATPASICANASAQLNTNAQLAALVKDYSLSTTSSATLADNTGATQVIVAGNDDTPTATAVSIGFTFNFDGNNYTQCQISPDGWLRFGSGPASNEYTNSVVATTNVPKLYPYWDDLATGVGGFVNVLTSGTAPTRTFIVTWYVTIPRNTTGAANSTFQAILYEGSNNVEFRYGTLGTGGMSASIGLTGVAAATNYNSVASNFLSSSNTVANNSVSAQPASGTSMLFSPPAIASYVWSANPTLSSTSIENPVASNVAATTTYQVTATSNEGCSASGSATVSIDPFTAVSLSATPNDTICIGTPLTLTPVLSGGGAPFTYAWSDLTTGTTLTPTPAAGSTTYSVTVSDNCGASQNTSITVFVNPLPTVSATRSDSVYCSPSTAAVALAASGANTYAWAPSTGLSATTGTNVNATPANTTTYTVTGTDLNGCQNTATLKVNNSAAITFNASASSSLICTGNAVTLTATNASAAAAYCQPTTTYGCSVDYISDVTFGSLSRTGTTCDGTTTLGYSYYTSPTATYTAGQTYSLSVSTDGDTEGAAAWIDYNQNGIFEASEMLINGYLGTNPATYTGSIQIPANALNGTTLLRVRCNYAANPAALANPTCDNTSYGETEDYQITISGGVEPYVYAWTPAAGLSNATELVTTTPVLTANASYDFVAISGGGCTDTATVAVTVDPITAITTQPVGGPVCEGSALNLSVTAVGGGLSYKWLKAGVELIGETNASLSIAAATPTDAGFYKVEVTGNCGVVLSDSIEIIINTPVAITSQPADVTDCEGAALSMSVSATGTGPISYQWYKGTNAISNATNATYSVVAMAASDAGTYSVDVTGACGTVSSANATVIVNDTVMISAQPATQSICEGSGLSLSVSATGNGSLSYQWYMGTSAIQNATNSTYSVASISAAEAGTYSVDVTGACGTLESADAIVTVNDTVKITSQPTAVTDCEGSAISMSVAATGNGTLTYQWYKGINAISTATSSTYAVATLTAGDAGTYSVDVTGACGTLSSADATVTVNDTVMISAQPVAQSICAGNAASFTVSATGTGLTYQWRKNSIDINNETAAALSFTAATSADAGTYSVAVTGTCGVKNSADAAFTVNPNLTASVTLSASSTSVCGSDPITFTATPTNGGTAPTYVWTLNGNTVQGVTGATYILAVPTALDEVSVEMTSNATPCLLNTTATSNTVTLTNATVTPTVAIATTNTTICSGTSTTFTTTAANAGSAATYQWYVNNAMVQGETNPTFSTSTLTDASTVYVEMVSNANCISTPNATSDTITMTVNPVTVISTQPIAVTQCAGTTATFTVAATGTGTLVYQWKRGTTNVGTSATLTINNIAAVNAGLYTVEVIGTCGSETSTPVALVVNPLTAISTQPQSLTQCAGTSATLSAAATGTGTLTYQWFKGANAIATATSSTYTIPSLVASDADSYTVVVTGDCASATSNDATITVNPLAAITTQPASATQCAGTTATFTAAATGTGTITYQWYNGTQAIPTATSATYSIANLVAADAGSYSVVATGACASATSNTATLTVNPLTAISTQPQSVTQCAGTSATLSVAATGTGTLTYQWFKGTNAIATATSSSYTIPSLVAGDADSYTVVVTGDCNSATSIPATITVNPLAAITTQPVSATLCVGTTATFTAAATGTGTITYQWYNGTQAIPTATSATFSIANLVAADAGSYSVVATGACASATSTTATLTVNPLTAITTAPAAVTQCAGTTATFTVAATGAGTLTYQWKKDGNNVTTGGTSATLTLANIAAANAGSYTVAVTGTCGTQTSTGVALVVNPLTAITTQPVGGPICEGGSGAMSVVATGTGTLTYQWNFGGAPIPGANTSSVSVTNATLAMAGNYTVSVTGACGTVTSNTAAIVVNALPIAGLTSNAALNTACDGSPVTFTATGGATYNFSVNSTSVQTGATATYTSSALANSNSVGVVVTSAAGCSSTATPIVMTINALPTVGGSSNVPAICVNQTAAFTATGASTYAWSPATGLDATTGANVNASPVTTTTYTVIGTDGNGCQNSATVALTVNNNPTITFSPVAPVICAGDVATITANGADTYVWTAAPSQITVNNGTITANPANTATYTVEGTTTATGCMTEASVSVTVNQLPVFDLGADPAICDGKNTQVCAPTYNGYSWSTGATTQCITVSTAGSYTVTVTDANGCRNNDNVTLIVNANPTVNLGNDTVVCAYAPLNVSAPAGFGYNWNDGSTAGSISVTASGFYGVTITDGNGCIGTDNILITVNSLPTPNLGSDTVLCGVNSINLTPGSIYASYNWSTGATSNPLVLSNTQLTAGVNNVFSVTVTNGFGCEGSDEIVVFGGCVNVDEMNNLAEFDVYPNPTTGKINVRVANLSQGNVVITVISATGQLIINEQFGFEGSEMTRNLDLSHAAMGIYFVRLQSGNEIKTQKIVVH